MEKQNKKKKRARGLNVDSDIQSHEEEKKGG
jgi:hypothetical protein